MVSQIINLVKLTNMFNSDKFVFVQYPVCYFYGSYLAVINGCVEHKSIVVRFKNMETYTLYGQGGIFSAWLMKFLPENVNIHSYTPAKIISTVSPSLTTDYVIFPK